MTSGSTPARRAAARANGRKGGRPRLFANGVRSITSSIPEDDARLLDLLAVRTGRSPSRLLAEAAWSLLAAEGFTPTWGVPDADRLTSDQRGRAAADGEPSHPTQDRAAPLPSTP